MLYFSINKICNKIIHINIFSKFSFKITKNLVSLSPLEKFHEAEKNILSLLRNLLKYLSKLQHAQRVTSHGFQVSNKRIRHVSCQQLSAVPADKII